MTKDIKDVPNPPLSEDGQKLDDTAMPTVPSSHPLDKILTPAEQAAPFIHGVQPHMVTKPINFTSGAHWEEKSPTGENNAEDMPEAPAPKVEVPLTMGFAAKTFAHMSSIAPVYLILLFALHVATSIWFPSVYFPTELAHVELYNKIQQTGQWFLPPVSETLGITFPGYYWFMALVDMLPLPESIYLPTLSALTSFIAFLGVYTLSLRTRLGKDVTFASGLMLLSCPPFLIYMHMVGPELLTAGLFCIALGLLFRGWTEEVAPFSFIFGFLFLALATFTGGFFPLWTALIASVLLILWRGTLGRAHHLDAVIGFGILILSFALWLIVVILGSEQATILDKMMLQGIAPFLPPYWPLPLPWSLVLLALALLPWTLLPIFASWFSILGKSLTHLKASRKESSGATWLYLVAVVGMALIALQKSDNLFITLPLVPVFMVIFAKTACNLSRISSNLFFLLIAVTLLACGLVLTAVSVPELAHLWKPYFTEEITRLLMGLKGVPILAGVFIVTALLLVKFTKRAFSQGSILVIALFSMLMVQPMTLFIAPSLAGRGAIQHPQGAGLGTLPPEIAPHMPTHPTGDFPVAPLDGEVIDPNSPPTPVITAPEPTPTEPTPTEPAPSAPAATPIPQVETL